MVSYGVYEKLIISGNVAELYEYERPLLKKQGKKRLGRSNAKFTDIATKMENRKKTQCRAKRQVYRIINANASQMKKFVTLTFKENITNIKKANHCFKTFIQRLNYYLESSHKGKLKYIAVIEFQERGAIHYHLLCNAPYIQNQVLSKIWGNGYVRINKIDNIDNLGAYVTKYMNKDLADTRLQGQKCYLVSKNLDKSIRITDKEIITTMVSQFEIKREYKTNYTTEYNGNVVYTQYVLKKDVKATYKTLYERKNISNFIYLQEFSSTKSIFKTQEPLSYTQPLLEV